MQLPRDALHKSVLIVAHPDDEVLWFSSLLTAVDLIIVCFLGSERWPELGEARRQSLEDHQYRDKIRCLDLTQVRSHNTSKWPTPDETVYGLRLNRLPEFDRPYKEQSHRVAARVRHHLKGARNIFTHNPWGEYGHEDHVQVSRIVTKQAAEIGANIWYDNYVSNKSSELMHTYMPRIDDTHFAMPVDRRTARRIADTYYRNDAWTWSEHHMWFGQERFVLGPLIKADILSIGAQFPMNYLRVPFTPPTADSRSQRRFERLLREAARRLPFTKALSRYAPST